MTACVALAQTARRAANKPELEAQKARWEAQLAALGRSCRPLELGPLAAALASALPAAQQRHKADMAAAAARAAEEKKVVEAAARKARLAEARAKRERQRATREAEAAAERAAREQGRAQAREQARALARRAAPRQPVAVVGGRPSARTQTARTALAAAAPAATAHAQPPSPPPPPPSTAFAPPVEQPTREQRQDAQRRLAKASVAAREAARLGAPAPAMEPAVAAAAEATAAAAEPAAAAAEPLRARPSFLAFEELVAAAEKKDGRQTPIVHDDLYQSYIKSLDTASAPVAEAMRPLELFDLSAPGRAPASFLFEK